MVEPLCLSSSLAAPSYQHGVGGNEEGSRWWRRWWSFSAWHFCRPLQHADRGWKLAGGRSLVVAGDDISSLLVIFMGRSNVPTWFWTLKEGRILSLAVRPEHLSSSSSLAASTCQHGLDVGRMKEIGGGGDTGAS